MMTDQPQRDVTDVTYPIEIGKPVPPSVTDDEVEAASLAYVQARFAGEAHQWRRSFPDAWRDLTERMRVALIAAAGVRAAALPARRP